MPKKRLWEKALEWGQTYGDIVYVENFGKPLLLINSYNLKAAVDLLSNKSAKYANRPPMVMAELEGWGWLTSVLPYSEVHRKQRTFQHRFLNSPDVVDYLEMQLQETRVTLKGILETPKDYAKHLRRLPGAVVMKNFYGHQVGEDDPYVRLGETAAKLVAESGFYLFLGFLPWLRHMPDWLPWIEFPRVAKAAQSVSHAIRNGAQNMVKKKMAEGNALPSMASILLSENTRDDGTIVDEEELAAATAALFIGGVDTSVTALMTFVLAMLKYPEVQERARQEISDVVGEHRLPTFEDMERLKYVRAVCTEVLRWQSIVPLMARFTIEDDEYNGYFIPAGTTVVVNVWAMSRNAVDFEDALVFRPERWLQSFDKEGHGRPPRPEDFIFGFGRRICPGQKWAEHLLFIAVASMMAVFKFESEFKDGAVIPPNDTYDERAIWHLGPSECKITPRSEVMASLIRHTESLY